MHRHKALLSSNSQYLSHGTDFPDPVIKRHANDVDGPDAIAELEGGGDGGCFRLSYFAMPCCAWLLLRGVRAARGNPCLRSALDCL